MGSGGLLDLVTDMADPSLISQCVVSAADYAQYWLMQRDVLDAKIIAAMPTPKYTGPERRAQAHDRRWYAGQGGRRQADRKR